VGISIATTFAICVGVKAIPRRVHLVRSVICVLAGLAVPPFFIASAFGLLGSIRGSHNSGLWLLLGWVISVGIAAVFAVQYAKRA
jgi:hypothetical protein